MREPRSAMQFEPNVTPFLDVLLVLLILFMFLTVNQRKAIHTQLPDTKGAAGDTPPIVLEVRPNATYTINTQPVRAGQLAARLREIYDGRPTKTIMVRGAPGVTFQDVVTAVDVARGRAWWASDSHRDSTRSHRRSGDGPGRETRWRALRLSDSFSIGSSAHAGRAGRS